MREIKFRAWDLTNKKWLLGYEYKNLGGFSMFGECMLFGEWSNIINQMGHDKLEVVLMQYTGLKDKNGVEIYEGDILQDFTWADPIPFKVEWQHCGCSFCDDSIGYRLGSGTEGCQIIGNIYENTDLLKWLSN